MKRITKSTLSSCRVDFLALNEFCRVYTDDVVKTLLGMLHDVLNAQNIEEASIQLQLNSLESLKILEYFDESVVPCEDTDELFGQSIPTNREIIPDEVDDIADDEDGWEEPLVEEEEPEGEEEPALEDLFKDPRIIDILDRTKNTQQTYIASDHDISLYNEIIDKFNKDGEAKAEEIDDYDDLPF